MFRLRRLLHFALPFLCPFLSAAAVGGQVFSHPPHPDPAAQEAALASQQAIRSSPNQFGLQCCQILQIPAAAFTY